MARTVNTRYDLLRKHGAKTVKGLKAERKYSEIPIATDVFSDSVSQSPA